MRRLASALLVVALASTGCLGSEPEDAVGAASDDATNRTVTIGDRPDTTFSDVQSGTVAAPDLTATLEAPPTLVPGEWWRIRFESPFTGESAEFVRVVADVDGDTYVIGMPHEGWYKEAVVYHTPAFGDVNLDLSYNSHDVLFTPLKFPLTNEQTWETVFSGGQTMTARVEVQDESTAKVTFTATANGPFGVYAGTPLGGGENVVLELVYDATIHEVREFVHPTVRYTVLEHGYDFEGWVTVPRGEDLVFFHGRIGPALDIGLEPAPPIETVTVEGGFNRVTFIQVVQGLAGAPGAYRVRSVAPDGTERITESVAGAAAIVEFHEQANPDGDWQFEFVAGGPGVTFIEGIAYHQYDIRLPDGLRRSDHSHAVVR